MALKSFLLFLCLATACLARIGETPEKLIERFGLPVATIPESAIAQGQSIKIGEIMTFNHDGWYITTSVIDGRCARITYSKKGDWTEEQIETVLTSNSQGAAWKKTSKPQLDKYSREWRRADGAIAKWTPSSFRITHPAYELAKEKAEATAKGNASKTPRGI